MSTSPCHKKATACSIRRANTGPSGRTTPNKRQACLTTERGPVETSSRPGPGSQLPHLMTRRDPSGPPSRADVRNDACRQVNQGGEGDAQTERSPLTAGERRVRWQLGELQALGHSGAAIKAACPKREAHGLIKNRFPAICKATVTCLLPRHS